MPVDTNLMRFGPRHNEVIDTHDMIFSRFPVMEYKWTPETVVGSESGRVARVWVWVGETRED